MRFYKKEKEEKHDKEPTLWHEWFAWYPVRIKGTFYHPKNNTNSSRNLIRQYAWLETVSRRLVEDENPCSFIDLDYWEYELI